MIDFALRSCGLHGHATFAPDEPQLRERLRADTAVGEAWRCLRCEAFVVGQPRYRGPADTAPQIPSGKFLRDRTLMRLLALERTLRFLIFTLLTAAVVKVRGDRVRLEDLFREELPLIRPVAEQIGWNPDNSKVIRLIAEGLSLSGTALMWVSVGLAAYAVMELIEAVGLWLMKRWGEYFAVIATSLFLPWEIYELLDRQTVVRVVAFVINVAAVVWLLWSKRLFGLNGGASAYRRDHEVESLLSVERAAVTEASSS